MSIYEAYIVLYKHQEWRLGGNGPATDPKKLTQAITKILKHLYPQLVAEQEDRLRRDLPATPDTKESP